MNTMNADVARHLNMLRARTTLVWPYRSVGYEHVSVLCKIAKDSIPLAQDSEIRDAARNNREATTWTKFSGASTTIEWTNAVHEATRDDEGKNALSAHVLEAARPVIDAMIEYWKHDYEQYRLACEQGVALPPTAP